MKFVLILMVFLALGGLIFTSQDTLALVAWRTFNAPSVALLLADHNAELTAEIGYYYFNGGAYDLSTAKRAYEKALEAEPGILWGHYQLARIYFVEGDLGRALEEINKELNFNPENLRALYIRGLIYAYRNKSGDLTLAEQDFSRFIEWAPSEWAGYNDLAWVLLRQSKFEETKTLIHKALATAPDTEKNPWVLNSLGLAELNLGEKGAAADTFSHALEAANALHDVDWIQSYPGNNPDMAASGRAAFIAALRKNLNIAGVDN